MTLEGGLSRILCCWELGGGSGHLGMLAALSSRFRTLGHHVSLVAKDVVNARTWLPDHNIAVFQAPHRGSAANRRGPALSYADLLLRRGYQDSATLVALCGPWLNLIELLAPDLMVVEHSPTAILAARIAGVPVVVTGTGFVVPPAVTPMPSLLPGATTSAADLQTVERDAVARINQALAVFGTAPIAALAELFDPRSVYLATYPELDHYGVRDGATYYGESGFAGQGAQPCWPRGGGDKVFAYMHPGYPQFAVMLRQLTELGLPALVVAPGIDSDSVRKYGGGRVRVQADLVDLDRVTEACRVIICHGGHGTLAHVLRRGIAPIVVPNFVEQIISAYRLGRQGLAFAAHPDPGRLDFAAMIAAAVAGDTQHHNAARFAARYPMVDSSSRISAMATAMLSRLQQAKGRG